MGLRVLVVDDEPNVRSALRAILAEEGFTVEVAAGGKAALASYLEWPPDVVLTDLRMPEMDGFALCRALHAQNPTLPVIVITAASDVASAVDALRAGARDYLTKPLDVDAMLRGIARVMAQASSTQRAQDEVLSIVSHDLRNPIAVIALRAQQLAELDIPANVGPIAAGILRSTQRMSRLVADLLDETRLRQGPITLDQGRHRTSELLADVAELALLAGQKDIVLAIEPAPAGDPEITCDRSRVNQALGNLVANAIKFSPGRTTIAVSARAGLHGVVFSVRDQGRGITAEALPRIFDRYWQPDDGPRGGGVGLGLYIVKAIVEAHGGRLSVDSVVGGGTTVSFSLPSAGWPPDCSTPAHVHQDQ